VGTYFDIFHLSMYALAEELDYPALKVTVFAKLATSFAMSHRRPPSDLKTLINAVFSPLGSPSRICKDDNGALHNIVVAAGIAHDLLEWTGPKGEALRKEFSDLVQGPEYARFWSTYNAVKEQNKDILQKSVARKEAAEKRARAAEQRKAGKDAAIGALAKGSPAKGSGVSKKARYSKVKAKLMKPDDDGDVEME